MNLARQYYVNDGVITLFVNKVLHSDLDLKLDFNIEIKPTVRRFKICIWRDKPTVLDQFCQVRDFIPRSRDFLNLLGCFWDFYFKNSISGFVWDFSELQVLNLVIKFLVKLAS